jgi:hypothetical protein
VHAHLQVELAAFVHHYVTHCANWAPGEQAAHLLTTMQANYNGADSMDCDTPAGVPTLPPPDVCFKVSQAACILHAVRGRCLQQARATCVVDAICISRVW